MTDNEILGPGMRTMHAVHDSQGQGHTPQSKGNHVHQQVYSAHIHLPFLHAELFLVMSQIGQTTNIGDFIEHGYDVSGRKPQPVFD